MSQHVPPSAVAAPPRQASSRPLDPIQPTPAKPLHTAQPPSHIRHSSHLSYFEPGTSALPDTYASNSASRTRAAASVPAPATASRPRRQTPASADGGRDRLAVDLTIAASLSEIEMQRKRAEREEAELCQALLESAVLARSAADPLSTIQDSSSTEQGVLRPSLALLSPPYQSTDAATGQQGAETVTRNSPPSEEWLSYARLRKDVALWLEGGPPGPTGTATATSNKTDDDYEREMLELAIRISLEEAAQLERGRHAFSAFSDSNSAGLEPPPIPSVQNQTNSQEEKAHTVTNPLRKSVPISIFLEDLAPIRRPRSSSEPAAPSRDLHFPTSIWSKDSAILDRFTPSVRVDEGKQVDRSYEQAWTGGTVERDGQSLQPLQSIDSPYEPSFYTPLTSSIPNSLTAQAGPSSRLIDCPSVAQTQIRATEASSVPHQPTICAPPSQSSHSVSIELASPASETPFGPLEYLTVETPRAHMQHPTGADDATDLEDPLSQISGRPLSNVSEQFEPETEDTGEQSRPSLRRMGPLPPSVGSVELDGARSPSSVTPPHTERPSSRKTVTFEEALAITPTAELPVQPPITNTKPKRPTIAALVGSSLTAYTALVASIVSPQQLSPPRTADPDLGASPTGVAEDNSLDEVVFGYLTSSPGSLAVEAVTVEAPFHQKSSEKFPEEIELSAVKPNRRSFAIETSRWSTLLKFMMWQGDVKLSTTSADQMAYDRPAECGATLTFRTTDTGQYVLRLVIMVISLDHSIIFGQAHELNIVNHLTYIPDPTRPILESKSKARQLAPTTFFLPDPQLLPTRLSIFSISLFMLRHLAHIAHSTQPAKDASASYYALRNLATAIQASPSQAKQSRVSSSKDSCNKISEEEDLLSRMRDRLRKLKKSPCPLNLRNLPCAQASKSSSPATVVERPPEDAEAVFGIGSTPSRGLFTVHTRTPSSLDVPSGRGSPTDRIGRRSAERSRPLTPISGTRTQEVPTGPTRTSVEGPRLGLGMVIRPRRVDPNGEISDLSEDEARWLPTLNKREYCFRFRE